ncbi:Zinc finger CCCH domain-containing protein 7A [Phlyctochytrium planicorne]|nr:Zinc finger CCCH domain-containing protein 7A [Phlyctochytrium planicorne]
MVMLSSSPESAPSLKESGNKAFIGKDYPAAIRFFTLAINEWTANQLPSTSKDLAILYANRAASHLGLSNLYKAARDCRLAITADPYRLASALEKLMLQGREHDMATDSGVISEEKSLADDIGDGLAKPDIDASRSDIDSTVANYAAAAATALQREPAVGALFQRLTGKEMDNVFFVRNQKELKYFFANPHKFLKTKTDNFIVFAPGTYFIDFPQAASIHLVGLGPHTFLKAETSHALWVQSHTYVQLPVQVSLYNFSVVTPANPSFSALCVFNPKESKVQVHLKLIDVRVHNVANECGLLLHGGSAELRRCHFKNTGKQAIEVRQFGSIEAYDTVIDGCNQGITAYGGARRVHLERCKILNCRKEGILATGTKQNLASRAQAPWTPSTNSDLSEEINQLGILDGTDLDVVMKSCEVRDCLYLGISIDNGAAMSIQSCALAGNSPYAISVKGESHLTVIASHLVHGKRDGVHIGINYNGNIVLAHNCFVGDKRLAVVDEASSPLGKQLSFMKSFFTKPAVEIESKYLTKVQDLTPIEVLDKNSTDVLLAGGRRYDVGEKYDFETAVGQASFSDLIRPARTIVNFAASHYYPIGNTHGFDLSKGCDLSNLFSDPLEPRIVNVFLGACGDVRNILKTSSSILSSDWKEGLCIRFVMNDISPSILARDLILLRLISDPAVSFEDILAIWSNQHLTRAQRKLVNEVCMKYLEETCWPAWIRLPHMGSGSYMGIESIKECLFAFLHTNLSIERMNEERNRNSLFYESSVNLSLVSLPEGIRKANFVVTAVRNYLNSGNIGHKTQADLVSVNPTLLEAPRMSCNCYWSSSIFRAVELSETAPSKKSLYQWLLGTVTEQIGLVRKGLTEGSICLDMHLGDVLLVAPFLSTFENVVLSSEPAKGSASSSLAKAGTSGLDREFVGFHFVDCSNTCDLMSLPGVLLSCLPVVTADARIYCQMMRFTKESPTAAIDTSKVPDRVVEIDVCKPTKEAEIQSALGMPVDAFRKLTGIRLEKIDVLPRGLGLMWRRDADSVASDPKRFLDLLGAQVTSFCGGPETRPYRYSNPPAVLVQILGEASMLDRVDGSLGRFAVVCKWSQWEISAHAAFRKELMARRGGGMKDGLGGSTQFGIATVCFHVRMAAIIHYTLMPMAIVVSKPVKPKAGAGFFDTVPLLQSAMTEPLPTVNIVQVFESFRFDVESGKATFLVGDGGRWKKEVAGCVVTLCSVVGREGTGKFLVASEYVEVGRVDVEVV